MTTDSLFRRAAKAVLVIADVKSQVVVVGLFVLAFSALASAACPTGFVVVKGRVENPAARSVVRVELIYSHRQAEDSAETALENASFTLKVPFFTQSRGPVVDGLLEKCDRKPKTVIVRLLQGGEVLDSKTLYLVKDFDWPFPNAYMLRLPLVLNNGDH